MPAPTLPGGFPLGAHGRQVPQQLGGQPMAQIPGQTGQSIMQPMRALMGDDGKPYCANCRVKNLETGQVAPRPMVPFEAPRTDSEGYKVVTYSCTSCGCKTAFRQSTDVPYTCDACGHKGVAQVWQRGKPLRRAAAQGTGTGTLQFRCPHRGCQKVLEAPRAEMGTRQPCPHCRRPLQVPGMQRPYDPDEPVPGPEIGPAARQSGAY